MPSCHIYLTQRAYLMLSCMGSMTWLRASGLMVCYPIASVWRVKMRLGVVLLFIFNSPDTPDHSDQDSDTHGELDFEEIWSWVTSEEEWLLLSQKSLLLTRLSFQVFSSRDMFVRLFPSLYYITIKKVRVRGKNCHVYTMMRRRGCTPKLSGTKKVPLLKNPEQSMFICIRIKKDEIRGVEMSH